MISHVPIDEIYGTGTSLRSHFAAFEQSDRCQFSLICPRSVRHGNLTQISDTHIKTTWHSINDIAHFVLPFRFNFDGVDIKVDRHPGSRIRRLISVIYRREMLHFVRHLDPDIIHLSSLVLGPLALQLKRIGDIGSIPVVSHVRELLRSPLSAKEVKEIHAVDMFVCIDYSARKRLTEVMNGSIEDQRVTVIQNPFSAAVVAPDTLLFSGIDLWTTTVFAIAGQVSRDKGVRKVCEAFLRANLKNSVLLVVGESKDAYGERVKALCLQNPAKLRWLGQQPNLLDRGFFNGIDSVVRGDDNFRTGRTVYEALFSGAKVIMPGTQTEMDKDPNLGTFSNSVFLYDPQNQASLTQTMQKAARLHSKTITSMPHSSLPRSNFHIYAQRMQECYDKSKLLLAT
jgi:hypothetical protein